MMKARPYASTSSRRMRMTRLLVLYVSLGTAALTAVMANRFLDDEPVQVVEPAEKPKAPVVETTEVLVAATSMDIGQSLAEGQLAWKAWPKDMVGPSFITREQTPEALTELSGQIVRSPIDEGEPLSSRKLHQKRKGGFLAASLQPGMRAFSVRISPETGAGGFILPEDHVDVLLTWREQKREGTKKTTNFSSKTILRNVRVLAIDQSTDRKSGDKDKNVAVGKTATLELGVGQIERLAQAQLRGDISLILRGLTATDQPEVPEVETVVSTMVVHTQEKGKVKLVKHTIAATTADSPAYATAVNEASTEEDESLAVAQGGEYSLSGPPLQ